MHIHGRVHKLLARGLDVWTDFINQEVGGMSEALVRARSGSNRTGTITALLSQGLL